MCIMDIMNMDHLDATSINIEQLFEQSNSAQQLAFEGHGRIAAQDAGLHTLRGSCHVMVGGYGSDSSWCHTVSIPRQVFCNRTEQDAVGHIQGHKHTASALAVEG